MDPEPKRMNYLFLTATPELLGLAPPLDSPRVPRERALHLTTALRQEFLPLIPTLSGVLVPDQVAARMADFEALEPRSLIYYAAELASETPWTSEQKARGARRQGPRARRVPLELGHAGVPQERAREHRARRHPPWPGHP